MREAVGPIAVIDFGGQYTHLINRTIRGIGFRAEVRSLGDLVSGALENSAGMVLSGGPDSVLDHDIAEIADRLRRFTRPVLGICFGHQLLAKAYGGTLVASRAREYGATWITTQTEAVLFRNLPVRQRAWMSHGDHVEALPPSFRVTATSDSLRVAAFQSADALVHGVQFHPEVVHTEYGVHMLRAFVGLCAIHTPGRIGWLTWSPHAVRDDIIQSIRAQAGDRTLFLLISGGVDSLVALELCIAAVGADRVHSLHIDTGFMRSNESRAVVHHLERLGYRNLRIVDAVDRYSDALAGVVHPEEKRVIIGKLFVDVFRDAIRSMGIDDGWMLVQGTIYPDRIETGGTERADRIKTHHNRVEEIEALIAQGRCIEPLAELYKHEVRQLGALLGLPSALLLRQPFPGPGLAVRIICSDTATPPPGYDDEQDHLARLVEPFGLSGMVLPVRSVGVQGDARTYRHPALVWFDRSGAGDWRALRECAGQVVNRLTTVNRVVWSDRAPCASLALGVCLLDRQTVRRLQEVDAAARSLTDDVPEIWQMPVVALPLFDARGDQAYVVRPVCSRDAMTADAYEMTPEALRALLDRLRGIPGVAEVFYDLTTKPPGTIEWE